MPNETVQNNLIVHALGKIVDRLEKLNDMSTPRDSALIEKDVTKFDYFLSVKKNNYITWYSLCQIEINLKRLYDIIDETVTPYKSFSATEISTRKKIVKELFWHT